MDDSPENSEKEVEKVNNSKLIGAFLATFLLSLATGAGGGVYAMIPHANAPTEDLVTKAEAEKVEASLMRKDVAASEHKAIKVGFSGSIEALKGEISSMKEEQKVIKDDVKELLRRIPR